MEYLFEVALLFVTLGALWKLRKNLGSSSASNADGKKPQGDGSVENTNLGPSLIVSRRRSPLEEVSDDFSLEFLVSVTRQEDLNIRSRSDPAVRYIVSLAQQTCTCEDFRRRMQNPTNHFSRWCKHLIEALREDGAFSGADEWQKTLSCDGHGGPTMAWITNLKGAGPVLVTAFSGKDWLNVYARKQKSGERIADASGPITKYGWNVKEKRWAYGDGPPGSGELRKLLKVIESVR